MKYLIDAKGEKHEKIKHDIKCWMQAIQVNDAHIRLFPIKHRSFAEAYRLFSLSLPRLYIE
jgi:hypothetical protein